MALYGYPTKLQKYQMDTSKPTPTDNQQPHMDEISNLIDKALQGDVKSLKKANIDAAAELRSRVRSGVVNGSSNLFHTAAASDDCAFLSEALRVFMEMQELVLDLLCQTDSNGSNPLHCAVEKSNIFTVKLLVRAYMKAATKVKKQHISPFLMKRKLDQCTPLLCCFIRPKTSHEHVARYLVSVDQRLQTTWGERWYGTPSAEGQSCSMILDMYRGNRGSVVFCAMRAGFSLLVKQILKSSTTVKRLDGSFGETPLHYASCCDEEVTQLLLEEYPELIGQVSDFGTTVLHRAVRDGATWLVKLMLIADEEGKDRPWNKACRRLIWYTSSEFEGAKETPLHIAAGKGYVDIAKLLIQGYKSSINDEPTESDDDDADETTYPVDSCMGRIPWTIKNSKGEIPLFVALKNQHDGFGVYMLSLETNPSKVMSLRSRGGKTVRELAIAKSCQQSVAKIFEITLALRANDLALWISKDGEIIDESVLNIIKYIARMYRARGESLSSERAENQQQIFTTETLGRLMELFLAFRKEPGKEGIIYLKEAAEMGQDWLVKLFLRGDKSLIENSTQAWQIACEKGHTSTLMTFIKHCGEEYQLARLWRRDKQTPLHHIQKLSYEHYKELLDETALKLVINEKDANGSTPLHLAIQRDDLELTKALLETEGIKLDIENKSRKTALDFLTFPRYISQEGFFNLYKELLASSVMTTQLKNRVDNEGDTALHRAIRLYSFKLVELLIATKGVEFEVKGKDDKKALSMIEELCNTKSDDDFWFKQYKALFRKREKVYREKEITTFRIAIEWEDLEWAKMLLESRNVNFKSDDEKHMMDLVYIWKRCCSDDSGGSLCFKMYKMILLQPKMLNDDQFLKDHIGKDDGYTSFTPLKLALRNKDLNLTKALLASKGMKLDEKEFHLLQAHCKAASEWVQMCKEITHNSTCPKLQDLMERIEFAGMRETLSLVAALIATITFAAGFTVPGGVDSVDGTYFLSTNPAFLVFTISNTVALCCSMVVLFLLLGPMIGDPQPQLFFVHCSLWLLRLSLGATMLAFMAGVYAMMIPKLRWGAILVLWLCGFALLVAGAVLCSTYWSRLKKQVHRVFKWKIPSYDQASQCNQHRPGLKDCCCESCMNDMFYV